ncbi:hypothetical protein ATDW_36680 (plasmid) [Asticcacaulis sp. DW145]|nr:hypothetical protein ATDW_36680 [Asticcacaulis sp. DW145]
MSKIEDHTSRAPDLVDLGRATVEIKGGSQEHQTDFDMAEWRQAPGLSIE